jgi:exodeoxyribonuclease VII small subunit
LRAVSKATKATPGDTPLPFEEGLKKLESIVESMESDELPLEQLLGRYEEGTRLARHCQGQLADAEVKLRQLEESLGGDFSLKPVAASADSAE